MARRALSLGLLSLLALLLLPPRPASAARLLEATVEVDGEVVLRSLYSSPDTSPPEVVWRYLGGPAYHTEVSLPADALGTLTTELRGRIVLTVRHGKRPLVEARGQSLTLQRAAPGSDKWFVEPGDVERWAGINGIPKPGLLDRSLREYATWLLPPVLVGVLLLALAFLLIAVLRRIRRRAGVRDV